MLRRVSWRFLLLIAALLGPDTSGLASPSPGPDEGAPGAGPPGPGAPGPGGGAPGAPGPKVPDLSGGPAGSGSLSAEDARTAKAQFDDAVALQGRRQFASARRKLLDWLEKWPGADPELRREADERSAENAFLGIEQVHAGGPSANRIDVELMGDGYLLAQQDVFRKHAEAQLVEFWAEPLYDEYASYFNVWRFDLASKEEGVDEVARAEPPTDPTKPPKKKRSKPLKEYSTALNCQAAGPQNQVWADPEMVFQWRRYLRESDGLSICFAKKGSLGMGGMGIATTGRRVAVVHEFGHAFVGLLDEYANNPSAPPGRVAARNAISGLGPKEPPDPLHVPWRHWIEAKNPEVGVFLGGATYQLGVWRPATSCAMNSGGGSRMCWVCREAGVQKLYEYVNPIDEAGPAETSLVVPHGETVELYVVPLRPKHHALKVDWFVEHVKRRSVTREDDEPESLPEDDLERPTRRPRRAGDDEEGLPALVPDGRTGAGPVRGYERHAEPWPPGAPPGDELPAKDVRKGGVPRSVATLEGLPIGIHRVTVRVRDDTRIPGEKFPWVLKDPDKILEERRTWTLDVRAKADMPAPRAPAGPTPPPGPRAPAGPTTPPGPRAPAGPTTPPGK